MYCSNSHCSKAQQANKNRYRKLLWCLGPLSDFVQLMLVAHCVRLVTNDLDTLKASLSSAMYILKIKPCKEWNA